MMDKLVEIFEKVRDLPYEIGPLYEGEKLIEYGRGGCGPKSRYLADQLNKLGYEVRVCITPYRWTDLAALPDELKKMPQVDRMGNHVYLKVKIDDDWALIDPSWDKNLSPALPANIDWNGKFDQIPAIKITEEKCMNYPEPYLSWRRENQQPQEITEEDKQFASQMNLWFESVRTTR